MSNAVQLGNLRIEKDEDGDLMIERRIDRRDVVYLHSGEVLLLARFLLHNGFIEIKQNEFQLPTK